MNNHNPKYIQNAFALEIQYLVFKNGWDAPSTQKLIWEIFCFQIYHGCGYAAISSMIRDRTRSIYREGAKGCLLKPDQAKRITDRMINRIDSQKIRFCLPKLPR